MPTKGKNKAVINTGVLISALAFGGVPAKAIIKAFTEADIYASP